MEGFIGLLRALTRLPVVLQVLIMAPVCYLLAFGIFSLRRASDISVYRAHSPRDRVRMYDRWGRDPLTPRKVRIHAAWVAALFLFLYFMTEFALTPAGRFLLEPIHF